MAKKNRECLTCGEKYSYCPTCNRNRPTWMSEFHTENCKNIFDICTRFNMEFMSKVEAQEALIECDLSNQENFKSFVKRDIENIFKEEPKAKRGKKPEMEIIEEVFEDVVHEVVETIE